jgi:hypothetical protein
VKETKNVVFVSLIAMFLLQQQLHCNAGTSITYVVMDVLYI